MINKKYIYVNKKNRKEKKGKQILKSHQYDLPKFVLLIF